VPGKVIADSRERLAAFAPCDEKRLLSYGDKNESFDFLVLRAQEPKELKVERKAFGDYTSSWAARKLDRQLAAVDVFIVELPSTAEWRRNPEFSARAWKHLCHISMTMPVMMSRSPEHTMSILRYLADADRLDAPRAARSAPSCSSLDGFVSWLGWNPGRSTGDGRGLGEAILECIDMDRVGSSINWGRLAKIPGVGPKSVQRAKNRLGMESS